jgi:hypothetical protein
VGTSVVVQLFRTDFRARSTTTERESIDAHLNVVSAALAISPLGSKSPPAPPADSSRPSGEVPMSVSLGYCDTTDVMLRYNGHWTESARRLRNSGAVLVTGVLLVVAGAGIAHLDQATLGGFLMGLGPACLAGAYAVWVGQRDSTKRRILEDAERWFLHDRLNDIAGAVEARVLVTPAAMENELFYRANMLAHWAGLDEYRDDFPYAPFGPRGAVGSGPDEAEGPTAP